MATSDAILLSRRKLLKGIGAGTVFLTGMARTVRADPALPNLRAAFLFFANGSHPAWTPTGSDSNFTLTPHLAPLEPSRGDLIIFRNMILQRGSGNPHKATTFSALGAGAPKSFDQTLADAVKDTTAIPSLELAIGFTSGGGGVASSLSQVNTTFLPGERNPVAAYKRIATGLGGGNISMGGDAAKLLAARKSLLDYMRDDVGTFRSRLGAGEKPKMDQYLQSLRDLETALGQAARDPIGTPVCKNATSPPTAADFVARVNDLPMVNRMFMDIMALSLGCGITRVTSMMWGGGESDEPATFMGMGDWHGTSHGDPAGASGQKMIKMQAYFSDEFNYLVQKLKSYTDVDGKTVLDNSVLVLGTQNGTSTQVAYAKEDHDRHNTPIILAGSCGGHFKTGRVIDCNNANHNEVYLAIAKAFGLPVTTIGDPKWNTNLLPPLG
jgi:hypothetical protein